MSIAQETRFLAGQLSQNWNLQSDEVEKSLTILSIYEPGKPQLRLAKKDMPRYNKNVMGVATWFLIG